MNKKRWKRPNEAFWSTVLGISIFALCTNSVLITVIALAMIVVSGYKLKDVDLEEECNSGFHFIDD